MTACLYVTDERNDRDLARELGSMAIVIPIPCGDCNFFGYDGLRVLVERKKIGDLAGCILGGRYLHQLQNAHEAQFERLVLVHEGEYRPGADGLLEIPTYRSMMTTKSLKPRMRRVWQPVKPAIMYSRYDQYLSELHDLLGILVKRSQNVRETATIIKALWLYYQKPPDDHQSLHQMYSGPHQLELLGKPGLVRRVSKELDGIGWERAKAVEGRFKTVREMSNASMKDWLEVEGIGRKIAASAVSQLGGKDMSSVETAVVVVAAVIVDNGKVLVCQRVDGEQSTIGKWEFPGGKVHFGEPLEDAVIREVEEELGVRVFVQRLLHAKINTYDSGTDYLVLFYKCRYAGSTTVVSKYKTSLVPIESFPDGHIMLPGAIGAVSAILSR